MRRSENTEEEKNEKVLRGQYWVEIGKVAR